MCKKCGKPVLVTEIFRTTTCPDCGADLHSCVNCKFYSVNGKKLQEEVINKLLEESAMEAEEDPFAAFSGNQFDLYKVNEKQKNKLYELIRNGTLSFWFWFDGIDNGKFAIDETKIDDPEYFRFLRLMRIVRQSNKKAT